jgi:hypothetical protein
LKGFAGNNLRYAIVVESGPGGGRFMGPKELRDEVLVVRELQGLFVYRLTNLFCRWKPLKIKEFTPTKYFPMNQTFFRQWGF